MSFVLPGNARQLRFTGEAKAYTDDPSGSSVALGKPRVRKATTPPPAPPQPVMTSRGVKRQPSTTDPSPGNGRITPVPAYGPEYGTAAIRQKAHSIDDEMATMALDREALDILPGGLNNHRPTSRPTSRPPMMNGRAMDPATQRGPSIAPIPHFRPARPVAQTVVVPQGSGAETRGRSAPLALWICAAVLAGVLSYHVTPAVMTHFEPPPARIGG